MSFLYSKNKKNCFVKHQRKIEGKNFSQQLFEISTANSADIVKVGTVIKIHR